MAFDLAHGEKELSDIANVLSTEIAEAKEPIVSRYTLVAMDSAYFKHGRKQAHHYSTGTFNKEHMAIGLYCAAGKNQLGLAEIKEASVDRDLNTYRFNLPLKGDELPSERYSFIEGTPFEFNRYDAELLEFSRCHPDAFVSREFKIEQKIVANSRGGIAIQSIPFFSIHYSQGHEPITTARDVSVVCRNAEDLARLPAMIKYLSDPTPDRRIKNAKTFAEAFDRLYRISRLKYGTLEEAGIPLSQLYDVVMLTGVPIHEIFGHHFEEPVRHLQFGESGTFKFGQTLRDKDLKLTDDPHKTVEGFNLLGYTHVDAYGRLRRAQDHIKDGAITGFLGSEYVDQESIKSFLHLDRSTFSGSALQYTDGAFPQNRMTCTVLDGKTEPFELEGKLCIVSHSGATNSHDKTYLVEGSECYVVRDGEPRRVIPVNVTGGINQALANLVLLDDLSYQTGTCQKAEPIKGKFMASMPVSQYARSQVWRDQQVYPRPIKDDHLRILINRR